MAPGLGDRYPVSNPVTAFWNAEDRPLDDHRSTLVLLTEADVVIIGSGFTGVATAYHILKDNPSAPSIVLLEARKVCSGATGRNGGHVKPDTYFNIAKYTKLFGAEAAAELAAFEMANVYAVKSLVEKEELECDFHLTRAIDVLLDRDHASETESAYRQLVASGLVNLCDTDFILGKDVERVTGINGAQCGFSFTAAHLWPAKMVHQLLQKLLDRSVNVQANTSCLSVSSKADTAGRWTVRTSRGDVKAAKVVFATNGYTGRLLSEYKRAITPIRGICSRIVTPRGTASPHLVNTYGIRFDARNNDYLIPRPDGSIIVGGARQRFWHNRKRWFDTLKDDEAIDEAVSYFDGYMQRLFRGWEDSGAKTDKVWIGSECKGSRFVLNAVETDIVAVMGYGADFMPHIGEVPDKPGQFVIAGCNGHGMPQILLSAQAVASMVRDGKSFEQTGLPGIFKTTRKRIEREDSPLEKSLRSLWERETKSKL